MLQLQNVTQLFKKCGAPVLENAVAKPESSAYSFVIPQGQVGNLHYFTMRYNTTSLRHVYVKIF